jgi:8-amino-7-oxononanoate synthase
MDKDQLLKYSMLDFFQNDSQSVLDPPADFEEWYSHPLVQFGFKFAGQPLLAAPRTITRIKSAVDDKQRRIINLTSYNYLGLSTHPEVIQAAKEALDKYGTGSSGSPMVSGTLDLHVEFARRLAEFKQKEDCLLYSSGFGGNLGALQGILRKGDCVVIDEKGHRSMIDGGLISGAKMYFFKHNDMTSLEQTLEKCRGKRTLVCVEGVYSMDGDLVKLPEVVELCDRYGVQLYMDEAHSSLMFGENGRGVGEHFHLEHKIGMSFGTLSKSFGGVGGFICSNARIIRYLRGYSSPWNFSCAIAPPTVAGLMKALEVATRDSSLRDKLWANTAYMRKHILDMGLNLGESESQVMPIIIGPDSKLLYELAAAIQQRGLFLQPVTFPAVPAETGRFRMSISAQLTQEDMDEALNIIKDVIVPAVKK